jgi:hypothetical protein
MQRSAILAVMLLAAPVAAGAQGGLAGPFGGLFGRAPERTHKEYTVLEFRTAVGGQYDAIILDDSNPLADLAPQNGSTAGVNGGLGFETRSDRLRLDAFGSATHQQFFREPAFDAMSYDGGGQLMFKVSTRLSLDASATYNRSPFYHVMPASSGALPVPEVLVPSDPFAARRLGNDTAEGMVGFTSPYTKRSTLSASVSRRATRFFSQPENDFSLWAARGMWTRKLSRDVAARVGYGREEIQQSAAADTHYIHEVFDIGLDLAREISVARRTALTVNTQTSMIRETGGERRYRLNGGVTLTRGFRRTWAASIGVTRNTEFLPGFLEPVFSDGASASISGMFADRIEWSAAVGASHGEVGFDAPGDFISYSGNSRLSAGITRHLGLYAEYAYYHYDMPRGSTSILLPPQQSRQSISVGVSAYVPMFTRVREPRDTR